MLILLKIYIYIYIIIIIEILLHNKSIIVHILSRPLDFIILSNITFFLNFFNTK